MLEKKRIQIQTFLIGLNAHIRQQIELGYLTCEKPLNEKFVVCFIKSYQNGINTDVHYECDCFTDFRSFHFIA